MSKRLEGKNAIVTAAGQGIGKSTAITFHNEGANVFATDINEKTLNTLNKEHPDIDIYKLDSTNKADVEKYLGDLISNDSSTVKSPSLTDTITISEVKIPSVGVHVIKPDGVIIMPSGELINS